MHCGQRNQLQWQYELRNGTCDINPILFGLLFVDLSENNLQDTGCLPILNALRKDNCLLGM